MVSDDWSVDVVGDLKAEGTEMTSHSKEAAMLRPDYLAAMESYPKLKVIRKFGRNPVIGATVEDVWSVGGLETLLTTAALLFISTETTGQTQTIRVEGLDDNWDQVSVDVALDGQNETPIPTILWMRVNRAYQVSSGAASTGDIWIYEDDTVTLGVPQTAGKIHGYIDNESAAAPFQTEKASFTVPRGHVALINRFHAEMGAITTGNARSSHVYLMQQTLAEGATADDPAWSPFRRVDIGHEISDDSNSDVTELTFPMYFPELTNIVVRAACTADSLIAAEFDLILLPHTT